MRRRFVALCMSCFVLLLCGCIAPFEELDTVGEYTPVIDPHSSNSASQTIQANLWLPIASREFFVEKRVDVVLSSGERLETAVLRALFAEQSYDDIVCPAVWPELQVVNITDDTQTLYVTLNSAFLNPPVATATMTSDMWTRTAVLSIANTLLALGEYSQVQILVEMGDNATAQRPTRAQCGFDDNGSTVLGPLVLQKELLLTPERAAETVLSSITNRNVVEICRMTDQSGLMPEYQTIQNALLGMEEHLVDFTVAKGSYQNEDHATTLFVDLTLKDGENERTVSGIPLHMVQNEAGVWKVDYESLKSAIF